MYACTRWMLIEARPAGDCVMQESWEAPLGLTDVTEIHQRVVGATPRVFDRALPMPDVFEPFLGGKLRSEYNAHVEG
jgi:hypothetical protein